MRKTIDWIDVIKQLKKAGVSSRTISKEVGVSLRTVNHWANAKRPNKVRGIKQEPFYSSGQAVLDLYKTIFGTTYRSSGEED